MIVIQQAQDARARLDEIIDDTIDLKRLLEGAQRETLLCLGEAVSAMLRVKVMIGRDISEAELRIANR